jgi:D-apiose dehydrogenase
MPSVAPLRVGLIGAGDIAAYHLRAWRAQPDVAVTAICDRAPERAAARAAAFGIPAAYASAEQMLAENAFDALDVMTWRDGHVAMVRLAAAHGIACLCQKPLAPTLAEAEALVGEVAGRIRLMVHENRRFAPHFRAIAGWLSEGRVGPIRQCHAIMNRAGFLPDAQGVRPAVRRSPAMATEPRLMIGEVFIHQLDVLRWLLGPLDVVAARTLRTEPEIAGETVATILMQTVERAPVVLSGSFVAQGFGTAVSDRLELIGSRASILFEGDTLQLLGEAPEARRFDLEAGYQACFDGAIGHFVARLRDGEPFETDAAENLHTLRLVEAAYAAAMA